MSHTCTYVFMMAKMLLKRIIPKTEIYARSYYLTNAYFSDAFLSENSVLKMKIIIWSDRKIDEKRMLIFVTV